MRKSAEEILDESKAAMRLYFHSEKDRYKLILARLTSRLISKGIRLIFAIAIICIAIVFFFTALAIYWGGYLDNYSLGCLYTGLSIIAFVIIVHILAKGFISRLVMKFVIGEIFEEEDENKDEDE